MVAKSNMDTYAFGMVVAYMVSGRRPACEDSASAKSVLNAYESNDESAHPLSAIVANGVFNLRLPMLAKQCTVMAENGRPVMSAVSKQLMEIMTASDELDDF